MAAHGRGFVLASAERAARIAPLEFAGALANRGQQMTYPVVIARAWRGEPWRCFLIGASENAAYLVGPDHLAELEAGECEPIAFPVGDIFEFEDGLYAQLRAQWERERRTDEALWRSAPLLIAPAPGERRHPARPRRRVGEG